MVWSEVRSGPGTARPRVRPGPGPVEPSRTGSYPFGLEHGAREVVALSDDGNDVPDRKEVKVKIFEEQHVKLHTVKILKGQTISTTMEEALERYFEEIGDEGGTPGLEEMWEKGPGSLA